MTANIASSHAEVTASINARAAKLPAMFSAAFAEGKAQVQQAVMTQVAAAQRRASEIAGLPVEQCLALHTSEGGVLVEMFHNIFVSLPALPESDPTTTGAGGGGGYNGGGSGRP